MKIDGRSKLGRLIKKLEGLDGRSAEAKQIKKEIEKLKKGGKTENKPTKKTKSKVTVEKSMTVSNNTSESNGKKVGEVGGIKFTQFELDEAKKFLTRSEVKNAIKNALVNTDHNEWPKTTYVSVNNTPTILNTGAVAKVLLGDSFEG